MPSAPAPDHPIAERRHWLTPRPLAVVLLLGLLIRESLSFWTGHPYDFEIWIRTGYVVSHGTDPYSAFWPPVPGLSIAYFHRNLTAAAYLPFWSLYTAASYQGYLAFGGGNRFVYYFLLKQAPIAADVLTAYLLYRIVERATGNRTRALSAAAFWSFFPYAILIAAVWGQFDPIAVAIILASVLTVDAPRKNLLYGLGILVKWVTAMFLPLEVFRRSGTARWWVALAILVPAVLTGIVFLSFHWGFAGLGGITGGEVGGIGGGMNWARLVSPYGPLALTGPYTLVDFGLAVLWVPGVIGAGWLLARGLAAADLGGEVNAVVGIVAVFLLLRWGLNEQYMLYLFAPLLVDVLVYHRERRALFATLSVLCLTFLVINNTLLVPFLSPLGPQYEAWTYAANNAPFWDPLRLWSLDVLAVLITITLAQLALVVLTRKDRATPWLFVLAGSRRAWSELHARTPPDAENGSVGIRAFNG
jgi:hypothetical protein